MKKFLLAIALISVLFLIGCDKDENLNNNNYMDAHEQEEMVDGDSSNENVTEARKNIQNALNDNEWIAENVSVKKTYFSESFNGTQELTYEILSDDVAIVQSEFVDGDEFGAQVFLIGYKDGKVQVISLPDLSNYDGVLGQDTFAIDSEKMVLVKYFSHQGEFSYTAYQISNLEFNKIDSISFSLNDENREKLVNEFEQKYNTHKIETKLVSL